MVVSYLRVQQSRPTIQYGPAYQATTRPDIESGDRRTLTFDKAEAERLLRSGKIISQVAAELGVRRQVIANHWTAQQARRLAKLGPTKRKR